MGGVVGRAQPVRLDGMAGDGKAATLAGPTQAFDDHTTADPPALLGGSPDEAGLRQLGSARQHAAQDNKL